MAVDIAWKNGFVVPAFNIPYLPMLGAVVQAVRDENSFALIQVARLEWIKFGSGSLKAVRDEYLRHADERHVRLHLDHVPVMDEDSLAVDYLAILRDAVKHGYESLMVDASRLSLDENIQATKQACGIAHAAGLPCEAELGAVLGHESEALPPYDELFESGKGFTKEDEAARFVHETGCDWLSVAIGNIHGAITKAARGQKKPQARLDIAHLQRLKEATGIPLVLHGGSGIGKEYILDGIRNGIAKINVGTEIRQAYENEIDAGGTSISASDKVFQHTKELIRNFFEISGTARYIKPYLFVE
jgi:ketose-bisphosphate aldolase